MCVISKNSERSKPSRGSVLVSHCLWGQLPFKSSSSFKVHYHLDFKGTDTYMHTPSHPASFHIPLFLASLNICAHVTYTDFIYESPSVALAGLELTEFYLQTHNTPPHTHTKWILKFYETRETIQQSRALAALAEDLSMIPSPIGQLTTPYNSSSMGSDSLFQPPQGPGTYMTLHTNMQARHCYSKINLSKIC